MRIQIVLPDRLVKLSLKQTVQGFLLSVTDRLSETSDGHSSALVVGDLQVLVFMDLARGGIRQQVSDLFVVDLGVTDPDRDGLVELVASQREQGRDGSGHDAAVLEDLAASRHRVSLAGARLAVAENRAVVAFDD